MWSSILVVVPLRVCFITNLPAKHVLVVISSDFIIIRSQNMGCYKSATKCEKCEKVQKIQKECKMGVIE